MISSKQWWTQVKNDPTLFNEWLVKQHRGEVTAAIRIKRFAIAKAKDARSQRVLQVIAEQENTHAGWVLGLLKTRGIEPNVENAEKRYWKEVLPEGDTSFEEIAAIGAHAEA